MGLKGWTPGLNHLFMLYTSSGEGSCTGSTSCAYKNYCAYHTYNTTSPQTIFGYMPYGNPTYCQVSGIPSPNGNPAADTALTAASHEASEAITDPLLNAWFSSNGTSGEIGDLCAYYYGTNTWDNGAANQQWSGHFYEVQTEFDNHAWNLGFNGCDQVGPFGEPPG